MGLKRTLPLLFLLLICSARFLNAFQGQSYLDYLKGLLDSQAGDLPGAIAEYNAVVNTDKDAAPVYKDLAYACWQAGDRQRALEAADKLNMLYGDNLYTQLFLGNFYMTAGMSLNANQAWEDALKIDPNNETAILYLAVFYSVNNNPQEALDYWDRYIRQKPGSAESYFQQGLTLEKLGNTEKAVKSIEKTIELKPDNYETYFALGQLYEKQGRLDDAIKECEKYLAFAPDNSIVLMYLGGLYYQSKKYKNAQDVFKKADKLSPNDSTILFWLGVLAETSRDWPGAISYFELLSKKGETPELDARLSYYYSLNGQGSVAIKYLKRAIKLEPRNPSYYYLLGIAYSDEKKYGRAKEYFTTALKLKPDFADAYFHLGVVLDEQGKFDESVSNLEKTVELDPKNSTALNYLGYSYAEKGVKLDRAKDFIEKALATEPGNAAFIESLGWVNYKLGKFEDAEKYLKDAASKIDDATILGHLGDAQAALGKKSDAWQSYKTALDFGPKNKVLKAKARALEKEVAETELAKAMIQRIAGIYAKIKSIQFKFLISGEASSYNFNFLGTFKYLKPGLWRADVLGGIQNPEFSLIDNGSLTIRPAALEQSLPVEAKEFFENNGASLGEFLSDNARITSEGKYFSYEVAGKVLRINKKSALPEELVTKSGISLEFSGHLLKDFVYLPKYINFAVNGKFKGKITLDNFEPGKAIEPAEFNVENNPSK